MGKSVAIESNKKVNIKFNKNLNFNLGSIKKYIDINTAIFMVIGFLLSRSVMVESIAPLGVAFYIYVSKTSKYRLPVGIATIAGILLSGNSMIYSIKYIVALFIIILMGKSINSNISISKLCTISILSITPISICQIILSGNYLYGIGMYVIEGLILYSSVYIFSQGVEFIHKLDSKVCISSEEVISLSILLVLSIMGIEDIVVLGISTKTILCNFVIIISAIVGGPAIGASAGAIVGLASVINNISVSVYMGIYSLGGLICGVFSKSNKYLSVLGYIIGWIITYTYTSGINIDSLEIKEIVIASLFVIFIPNSFIEKIKKILNTSMVSDDILVNHIARNKDLVNYKLNSMHKAYSEVADIFDRVSEKDKLLGSNDISKIIDNVYADECTNCGMKMKCWENRFNYTYTVLTKILEYIEDDGYIEDEDIIINFNKECMKPQSVIKSAKHNYEIFSLNYEWNLKFSESRKLIAQQIRDISKSIKKLSTDVSTDTKIDFELEKSIYDKLNISGIKINQVTYITKEKDEFEIVINKPTCSDCTMCDKNIIPIIEEIVEDKLTAQKIGCNSLGDKCSISLRKSENYKISTSSSCMSKDGYIQSGDNFTHMEIEDGKYMIALSDGMGKGPKAYEESSTTIDLLEKMIDARINNDIIVSTINNMLILKSQDEMFSTLDLSIVDLKKGIIETTKMGACSTYIKRYNGDVDLITSSSLPVGILSEISLCKKHMKIGDGDYVIMVSDGIVDAGKNHDLGENWLIYFLKEINTTNPKEISNLILDKALDIQNNNVEDDMTVLVSKIIKL